MKHTRHAFTACLTATATLGLVAALGFAQPDSLDTQAGATTDTQPSLASIDQKLNALAMTSSNFPPNLKVVSTRVLNGQSVTLLDSVRGNVRLYAFNVTGGRADLRDADDTTLASATGPYTDSRNKALGSSQLLLGGISVPTPLTVEMPGSTSSAQAWVYYWIEE